MADSFKTIDFHSHILPALDHGSKNTEQALEQLALMSENGTDIAVATSHFYPHEHKVSDFIADRNASLESLKLANVTRAPRIILGAEVLLCRNLHKMEDYRELCIKGTNVMLLELPLRPLAHGHFDTVETMMENGITVVLAHIDRYLADYEDSIDTFLSMGTYAQINANSLSSGRMKKKILYYLEQTDKICAIGSDLHGSDSSSYKKFVKSKKILDEYYPTVMKRSEKILRDAEILSL